MTTRLRSFFAHRVWLSIGVLIIALMAGAAVFGRHLILYNHSPSIPVGLYVRQDAPVRPGAFVTVRARDVAPRMAAARGFDDASDRFIKRVAAMSGDEVCAEGDAISINGEIIARRAERSSDGQVLSAWSGCVVLGSDDFFLLGDTADSYDGRYWGPVQRPQIEGVWRPFSR